MRACDVRAGCSVYFCDFHREQSWERWTKTLKHGVSAVKDQVQSDYSCDDFFICLLTLIRITHK